MSVDIIASLEAERDRINAAIAAYRGSGNGGNSKGSGKRFMSVEARRKISEAATKRWAKKRREAKKEAAETQKTAA